MRYSLLHVERSASLAAPRALVCSTSNATKPLAENVGPELFHVERAHGLQPRQVALICFTWNVTESLTALLTLVCSTWNAQSLASYSRERAWFVPRGTVAAIAAAWLTLLLQLG
jgi:hypothetical protein